jgi:hypothetical protein
VLEELEEILDVNFREGVTADHLSLFEDEDADQWEKDGDTIRLNLARLDDDELQDVLGLASIQFENEDRVLRHEEEVETEAMQRGYSKDFDEIAEFFEPVLSPSYHDILERSLWLRAEIEERDLTKDQIQEKKGQIARRHGAHAIYLSSLVSAGYFDPNGGLRDMLVDMELNEGYDRQDYQRILEEYVEKELFCVFVENDDDTHQVVTEVRGGLSRHQDENPVHDWFDIRGIGQNCEEIIDEVMEELHEEFMSLDADRWNDNGDHWVRIHPDTLPPISG